MSKPFNDYWLEMGAAVPVDIDTTQALVEEVRRLRTSQAHAREWCDLSKAQCWDILVKHKNDPFSLLVEVQNALQRNNT
jgi:hypothetical protein